MDYREAITALNQKFESLAACWGDEYHVRAGIVLERGILWIRRRNKGWSFIWEEAGLKSLPLSSASVEVRLDAVHSLPALLQEMQENHTRRMGDVEEAHRVMDKLLQDTGWEESKEDSKED